MWTKICGFTQSENAQIACQLGVSAIGLNFFKPSKRFVSVETARQIVDSVGKTSFPSTADIVGVFVNSGPDEICRHVSEVGLTAVQFHGDESTTLISDFHRLMPSIAIVRAVRVSMDRMQPVLNSLDELIQAVPLRACLLDAFVATEYGGTGAMVDRRLIDAYLADERPRLILAGGLTPGNVAQIVGDTHPWGVDTASGVESAPGMKDPLKMAAFIENCRAATGASGKQSVCRL
jgi:phosphoribosylanthranilate isomerase